MIDLYKVGAKIATLRRVNQLTQDDLAEKMFVSRQLISKWENGIGLPNIDTLLELCKLFKVSFEEILCLDDDIIINYDNIFQGHDRMYIIKSIINNKLQVDLAAIFYQLSNDERMIILKNIKKGIVKCDLDELFPRLTIREQKYLLKGEK